MIILTFVFPVLLFPHEPSHQNLPKIPWFRLSHPKASPRCRPTSRRSILATIHPNPCVGRKHRRPESQNEQGPEENRNEGHQDQALDCRCTRGSRGVLCAVCGCVQGRHDRIEEERSEARKGEDERGCSEGQGMRLCLLVVVVLYGD